MARPKMKHHERQQLVKVDVIRGRVLRLMQSSLGNIRSFVSMIDGNEHVVERLRGKSGDEILARCADFVMMEIGDNAATGSDASTRALARKVKGAMGPESEAQDVA